MGSGTQHTTLQLVVFFLVVMAVSFGTVLFLVKRFARTAPRRHVVVESWTPIVTALSADGVADPGILACALANYDLAVAGAGPVAARLPSGIATVADALGLSLLAVQERLVLSACTPEGAAELLERVRALRGRLEALPGVSRVGGIYPDDPETLVRAVRAYAKMCGIPLPRS